MSNLRPGYHQTEVGVIPQDWDARSIRSLCQLINGRGFKPYEWSDRGLPIIRIQNLNGSDEFNYFSGQYSKKIEVEPEQLLFAWSGSRGTSFGPHIWHGPKAVLNYHTWKLVHDDTQVDKAYFLHGLKRLTAEIEASAHGASALVHTQKKEMEGFLLPIPPLLEQQAIAEALGDADALIAGLEALIAKKRDVKQGAMQDLLTGHRRGTPTRLGSVLKIGHGRSQKGVEVTDGPYPILASGGHIGTASQFLYDRPSVLIGRKGTIDRPQYAETPFWTIDTLFYTVISEPNLPKYLFYQFCMINWRKHNEASGVPSLSAGTIENIEIELHQPDEQRAIAAVLSDMDAEIAALEDKLAKARAVKQGMMQVLLTGEIRLI